MTISEKNLGQWMTQDLEAEILLSKYGIDDIRGKPFLLKMRSQGETAEDPLEGMNLEASLQRGSSPEGKQS
jgi:hypothetical protein